MTKSRTPKIEDLLDPKKIKDAISSILLNTKGYDQKYKTSLVIRNWLANKGRFFRTDSGVVYFFDIKNKSLLPINDSRDNSTQDFKNLVNGEPELNPTLPAFEYLFQDILKDASDLPETRVNKVMYFDEKRMALYFYGNNGATLKITASKMELVDNGSDEILFVKSGDPINLFKIINAKQTDALQKYYLDRVNFRSTENITVKEQKLLLEVYLHSLFFESIQPTKPIVVFQGETGSGKTDALKAMGKILIGDSFHESSIQKEERDFQSAIYNNYYYQLDNMDANKPNWFEDAIATMSTGGSMIVRTLYKNPTDEPTVIHPHCFVSISTMNAKFTRQDVANRTLVFELEKLTNYENSFLPIIGRHREEILGNVFLNCQKIIKALEDNQDIIIDSKLRLADFAAFLVKTSDVFNIPNTDQLINKINKSQNVFSLQNDPLLDYIMFALGQDFYRSKLTNIATKELFKIVKEISEGTFGSKFVYGSPRSFGIHFKNKLANMKEFLQVEDKLYNGERVWSISEKREVIEEF